MKQTGQLLLNFLGWNTQGDLGDFTFYTNKQRLLVWFVKAPPLEPPSFLQLHQRNRFRFAALSWQALRPEQRQDWETASKRAHLTITGYDFYVYHQLIDDPEGLKTVERQSGIPLIQ